MAGNATIDAELAEFAEHGFLRGFCVSASIVMRELLANYTATQVLRRRNAPRYEADYHIDDKDNHDRHNHVNDDLVGGVFIITGRPR